LTIRRGASWGETAPSPTDAVEVRSDSALAAAVTGDERTPVVVRGGDLHRSLGAPTGATATTRLPIDVINVVADHRRLTAVAHVVARRRGRVGWWRGPITAVMNVDHLDAWDAAPRAHPNDGWLDVIEVDDTMSWRSRWQAWRRLPTGSHLPHPDIGTRRVRTETFTFDQPLGLWVDGVERGTVRSLSVEVVPDGAEVHV
jgi:YegS C-terminal NAD kinase beta sandwich-like domain